jgi:hypothetical protein
MQYFGNMGQFGQYPSYLEPYHYQGWPSAAPVYQQGSNVDLMDKLKRFERVVDNELLKQDPVIKHGEELQGIKNS